MDNLGDIVMLTPALRSLRKKYPQASISIMVSPAGNQMVPLLPWVDEVIVWRATWQDISGANQFDPTRERQLIQTLKDRQFDAAFIFTSFTQSPYPPAYACYLAGIPIRVGLSNEFGGGILSHWGKPPAEDGHQVDRNLAVLRQFDVREDGREMELHVPPPVEADVDDLCAKSGIPVGSPWVIVAPGASCNARRYPVERFAQVVWRLAEEIGNPILLIGSERERESLRSLQELALPNRIISLIGKTSVPEMVELIRRSELVIANNSASLHIADAFQIPQVILYSGTEYRSQWMPRFSLSILLRRETHCSPCYRFECPFNLECLDVDPEEVVHAAVNLIQHMDRARQRELVKNGEEIHLSVEKNGSNTQRNRSTFRWNA